MVHMTETFWSTLRDGFSSMFAIAGIIGAVTFTYLVFNFLKNNLDLLNHPKVFAIWSSLYGTMVP